MIAAIYVLLVEVFKPFSYGIMQVRIASINNFTLFYTYGNTGLTVGVLISNTLGLMEYWILFLVISNFNCGISYL